MATKFTKQHPARLSFEAHPAGLLIGDTMLMFALGCVVGFIAFPIVIFLASATIAINGWMT